MTRLDEIRHSAWQHRDLDITEDYAQGHEQPWASIRLRDPLRVGWATVAGWLVIIAVILAALAWAGCFDR